VPYADIDALRIWYEDSGAPGPLAVLLHGAAGSSECWTAQVPAFGATGFRTLTYDLRGFGRTRAPAGQETVGSIAADLEGLTKHLDLRSFSLVAQAYGGFGALEFTLDNPAQVRALVVSTSFGGLSDPEFTALRARYVPAEVARLPVEERELGATYRATNPEGVRRFLQMESNAYRPAETRQQMRVPMTLSRLESMAVPTLLIAGEEDVLAPPPVMHALADRIPDCRLEVIAGAGHCAYWEQPDVWNALVLDFLREHATD
jgi:pimeloyl-ACP methyl ester carboxylesterase